MVQIGGRLLNRRALDSIEMVDVICDKLALETAGDFGLGGNGGGGLSFDSFKLDMDGALAAPGRTTGMGTGREGILSIESAAMRDATGWISTTISSWLAIELLSENGSSSSY